MGFVINFSPVLGRRGSKESYYMRVKTTVNTSRFNYSSNILQFGFQRTDKVGNKVVAAYYFLLGHCYQLGRFLDNFLDLKHNF